MLRWFLLAFTVFMLLFFGLMGFRYPGRRFTARPIEVFQDMDHQYKVKPQQPSDFFVDGISTRIPVEGTVAMGASPVIDEDLPEPGSYYFTGLVGDFFGQGFPEYVEVDEDLLKRGQERYNIYCSVCHGYDGGGKGVVSQHWLGGAMPPTANLTDARASALPEGKIYHTITNGQGLMGPYNGNVNVADRWAITAYVRALQKTAATGGVAKEGARDFSATVAQITSIEAAPSELAK
ncbi:MAG: cytochrome c [Verrucomicrobiota bacterium]